jgi:hypothetical protein
MTRGQQFVLFVLFLVLLGVIALGIMLLSMNQPESSAPTLTVAVFPTSAPTVPLPDTPTHVSVPTWTLVPTWTPELPTDTPTPSVTSPPDDEVTPTFFPTYTPAPTPTVVITESLPAPTETVSLQNPGFEGVDSNVIPGWDWWADDNFEPGGEYNPDSSFETPLFKKADDPARFITGPTLQIDAVQHLKFKVHVFQTVAVSPTTRVDFQVSAGAFAETGIIWINAGVDPDGGLDCTGARWGEPVALDQSQGVQTIVAPRVKAGEAGRITVCLYAEALYAAVSNAAFFDDAELILK